MKKIIKSLISCTLAALSGICFISGMAVLAGGKE